ncbi:MAG TPA: hypothetical protein VG710_10185 [Opitutus sp.]|nr:hypothetical protein [Opitutus sp.]
MIRPSTAAFQNTMRTSTRFPAVAAAIAFLLLSGGELRAEDGYRLETNIYVFQQGDFQSIDLGAATPAADGTVLLHSPATIAFDQEKLALTGADFSWNGGTSPSKHFSRIETPVVRIASGRPVTMFSALPVQYLEKAADGSLLVRNIPKDSPDAPHWRLTFTLETAAAGDSLPLVCDVDIASVGARENLPGVTLPVGRPVLARFNEKLDLLLPPGEWAAFVVRAPKGSDYSLLMLLKIAPENASVDTAKADGLMTAQELAQFVTYYYRHPQPERIARAIESLGPSGFLNSSGILEPPQYTRRAYICVGFFAKVFAANPEQVAQWRKTVDQQNWQTRDWLRLALKLSAPGAKLRHGSSSETERCWGAFFASGHPGYLRQLVRQLEFLDHEDRESFNLGVKAMLSLAYHVPSHPLVRQTLEEARKRAAPQPRRLIDDVLNQDLAAMQKEIQGRAGKLMPDSPFNANSLSRHPSGSSPDRSRIPVYNDDFGPPPDHEPQWDRPLLR